MISEDFKSLMKLLFHDRYKLIEIKIKLNQINNGTEGLPQIVNIKLMKEHQEIDFISNETDVIEYCFSLNRTIDSNGDWEFYSVKDIERYYSDIDFLRDPDKEKLSNSIKRVIAGEFKPKYIPEKLVIQFLLADNKSEKRHSKKFEQLKEDYFDILASCTLDLKQYTDLNEKLKIERDGYKRYSDSVNDLITTAFRSDSNQIKNYLFFKKILDFDIEDLIIRTSKEKKYHNYLFRTLSKTNPHPLEESTRALLDVYRRYVEVLSPFINALRISIEVCKGDLNPKNYLKMTENCRIIREENKLSHLVDIYDPSVRNSESHSNTIIDQEQGKILITEKSKGKRIVVKEIELNKMSQWVRCMERDFTPAITITFNIQEQFQLLLAMTSFEYLNAIVAIGNKR
jgi:hypothetical protein